MRLLIPFLLAMIFAACRPNDSDATGVEYSGKVSLNKPLDQFTAASAGEKDIILNMTGPRELTFNFNDKISHIDYEDNVIIFRSETDKSEWTAKKIRGGFELEDGTRIKYGKCNDWNVCLLDQSTDTPILKGRYSLSGSGSNSEITVWISDTEKHVELLGFMVNGLFNRSRNEKLMNDAAFETLSPQVWTYH